MQFSSEHAIALNNQSTADVKQRD